jgi:hypothetical protein
MTSAFAENSPADVNMTVSLRRAFVRLEKDANLTVEVENNTAEIIKDANLEVSYSYGLKRNFAIASIPCGKKESVSVPLDTNYKAGGYSCDIMLHYNGKAAEQKVEFDIVGRRAPLEMPVIMWNSYTPVYDQARQLGFTHSFLIMGDIAKLNMWKSKEFSDQADTDIRYRNNCLDLDNALKNGYGYIALVCPGAYLNGDPVGFDVMRIDKNGQKYEPSINVCANFPEVRQFGYNAGATIAKTYGQFPAFSGAIAESEVRDYSNLCFHSHDIEKLKRDTGMSSVPSVVNSKSGIAPSMIEGITAGVVTGYQPALEYLKWFWQKGDGWNELATQTNDGLKSFGNKDTWTFIDPAVRTPSISGSGGKVDIISQWTYSYPDPIKIGKATDELFAMAALSENKNQKVMTMSQIIWYRDKTAPKRSQGTAEFPLTKWEETKPDADFITIAPDHLRETFWCEISRPVQGIMYHGWESLVDLGNSTGYVCTNYESQKVLDELLHTVIKPLGPTLLQVPDRKSDVAFLQSFTSEMLASVGEFGWGLGWGTDSYEILRYSSLQPEVVYEETIERNGLGQYKVLVLTNCPYLPEKIVRIVKTFQRKGGILIGDEKLCAAIMPDILITSAERKGHSMQEKEQLLAKAAELRQELRGVYQRYVDSNNPEIVLRARKYKNTDYVFSVNDRRTFGDYVGGFGLVMEKGLSANANIAISRKNGSVYDLVEHKKVDTLLTNDQINIYSEYSPGSGKLYMVTDRAIDKIRIETNDKVKLGESLAVNIAVLGADDKPIDAIIPLQIEIQQPDKNLGELSGFYGAKDGKTEIALDIAPNDSVGTWTIVVSELASGIKVEKKLQVLPD